MSSYWAETPQIVFWANKMETYKFIWNVCWLFPLHTSDTSDTSTTHPTQFAHTLWLLTVSGLVRNWHSRKAHTITHSWKNNTCQTVTHPGTNAPNCCLTSTSSVTGILPLSYWDKIKVQVETRTSILYPNASLSKPPLSNHFTRWQGS